MNVLEIISTKSCIKFEELSERSNLSELGYVHVLPGDHECSSNVGFSGGIHLLKLDIEVCEDLTEINDASHELTFNSGMS